MASTPASVDAVPSPTTATPSSAPVAAELAPVAQTVSELEKPKAISAAVQAILNQIAKMPQTKKTENDTEMDQLRRMAETVNRELVDEELIRTIGEASEASANELSPAPARSSDGTPANGAPASERNAAARSNSSAYASQMQAYRENA